MHIDADASLEEDDDDLPADYDYHGFSRGSEYHDKKRSGQLNTTDDGHVNNAADKRKDDDKGHC